MNRAEHLSISGATGTGKSALARHLLFARQSMRRLILDPLDEYEASAVTRCDSREQIENYLNHSSASEGQLQKDGSVKYPDFSLRYVPDEPEPEAAGYLAEWSMHLGDCTLMIDEAHEACSRHMCAPSVLRATKRGRHRGVRVWIISQRPSDIHPSLRAELNAQEAWYLRLAEHRDLEILAARRGKHFAERVANLPELHALRLRPLEQEPEEFKIKFRGDSPIPQLIPVG